METKYKMCLIGLSLSFLACFTVGCGSKTTDNGRESKELTEIQQHFRYDSDEGILISGHRGSIGDLLPENCLETFEKIAVAMPVFYEIDPRLTRDSVIVLMHDATLDRTTDGKGKLSDYTWEQVQAFHLKDFRGELTSYKIPKLEDAIRWSKGKVVLNLDKKDVPMEMIVDIIRKCEAEEYIMLTVHTGAQARYYYDRFPRIMLSAFVRNEKEYEDMSISGVPWENMIAYVGHTLNEGNKEIVERLRQKNVRCMISVAPTHDRLNTKDERAEAYRLEIGKRPDIIESDYPFEVWNVLKSK